jgi:hypothetical protein
MMEPAAEALLGSCERGVKGDEVVFAKLGQGLAGLDKDPAHHL